MRCNHYSSYFTNMSSYTKKVKIIYKIESQLYERLQEANELQYIEYMEKKIKAGSLKTAFRFNFEGKPVCLAIFPIKPLQPSRCA